MTKSIDLGDALAYAGAAAGAQALSHLVLARDPKLPESWEQLVARYTAGSGIVALTMTLYALRHGDATAREAIVVHWAVLLGSGAMVASLHLRDWILLRAVEAAEAKALDDRYNEEDGRATSPPPPPLSLPRRRGA